MQVPWGYREARPHVVRHLRRKGFLDQIRTCGPFWKQAGSLRLKRQEPVWSAGGKFMPLCVAERLKAAAAART